MILRSYLFHTAFWLYTFCLGLIALPLVLLYRPFTFDIARLWARGNLLFLRLLCGVTHQVKGREHIPQGPSLIASKHQSAWDTVIFWTLLPKPVYVLKRELIFIPVFGWYLLLLDSIYINRSAGASALKRMLKQTRDRLQKNASVVIFPEGTRTPPGAAPAYQPGVAMVYQQLALPIVPVALNSGICWGKNARVIKPGVITIEFLPPIPPGMKSREFMPKLQETIETASRALLNSET